MNLPSDESESWEDEPSFAPEGRQVYSLWSDFASVLLIVVPALALLPVIMLIKPDYGMILFTSPIGLKMLLFALAMLFVGMVVHFFWRAFGSKKAPRFVSVLIILGVFVFFYLPFMFSVLVGPAAIAIYERLLRK